jgi:endogenous inhibitor of DNA gyrase (YacG/DUF329 family)
MVGGIKMGKCVCIIGNASARKEQRMKCECQNCGLGFELNRMWQKFCSKQCQQKWNKDRYRAEAVEEEQERLMLKGKGNGHDRGTPEQRKEASEALARLIERGQGRIVRRI